MTELTSAGDVTTDDAAFATARGALDRLLATAVRVGRLETAPHIEWEVEMEARSWQLARVAPLTPLDQYQVLMEPTRTARLNRLCELIQAVEQDLELMHDLSGE